MRMIQRRERVLGRTKPRERVADDSHPMRVVTRSIARDEGSWDAARAKEIEALFDGLAADWDARFSTDPARLLPLEDAIARGGPVNLGRCLDLGCGTGLTTAWLRDRFLSVVGLDLSSEMLRRARDVAPVIQADAGRLPVRSASVDVIVAMNVFLFPSEVDRVLTRDGVLLWLSAIGEDTPIYLPADEVVAAMPGAWSARWSEAGDGTWAVVRRGQTQI
jgi:predicted TPR repeat methyltransferase